jgi:hypothetical protein
MRLVDVMIRKRANGARITGTVERGRSRFDVYFDYQVPDATSLDASADAFAAAMLLPCMRAGESLEVTPPISPQLSFNLPRIRDIFHTWWPRLSRIEIITQPSAVLLGPAHDGAATFFSGGVDSFYSLLKHRRGAGTLQQPLTHIVYMRGVETRLEDSAGVDETTASVQRIAEATGVKAIIGESNIRTSLQGKERNLHYERNYSGSALAAVGLGLTKHLACICIPSPYSYNYLIANGSTPLVDEMYSTERLRILHDGAEVTRAEKVARIVEWDPGLVLTHLRVCIMNRGGAFNCGKCYKCVRTAIVLRALGVWDQARTFPNKATDHWDRTLAEDRLRFTEENLQFAQERGGDAALVSMLRAVVRRHKRREGVTAIVRNSPLYPLLPLARQVRSIFQRK